MKIYTYNGFYGDYGKLYEYKNGHVTLECVIPGFPSGKVYRKKYKSMKGAKIALSRISDSYTIKEYKGDLRA